VRPQSRGRPGDFDRRLARVEQVKPPPGTQAPLSLLRLVLRHQQRRAADPTLVAAAALATADADQHRAANRFPLLNLAAIAQALTDETARTITAFLTDDAGHVPHPLAEAGRHLALLPTIELQHIVETWLDDPSLVDPRTDFWVRTAAAPILEPAAAAIDLPPRHLWSGSACPACGGLPQVAVIAEESGEFMAGSPRSLVCFRCASWWAFPRATCVNCRLDDSRQLFAYHAQGQRGVRVDGCERCRTYIKTFDLREEGSRDVVPLVDDLVSLVMDLWAAGRDLHRPVTSLAGT
jgi:formate dehydrogenase maturation protein FdhE